MTVSAPAEPASSSVDSTAERDAAFSAFVATHRDRALATAWRLCGGDGDAAEDVTQEAFTRAWRAFDGFRGEAQLSTWFYRVLVRAAHNRRRWHDVRSRWDRMFGEAAPRTTEPVTGDDALKKRIAQALDGLSRGQREAFVLVHMQGFTVTEAAEVLGRAPGTVKSHLHRALVGMRAALRDVYEEEVGT